MKVTFEINRHVNNILLFITLFIMIGCEPSMEDKVEKKRQEVMDLHNESMLVHGEVVETLFELEEAHKEWLKDSSNIGSGKNIKIQETLAALKSADENMMTWMHAYTPALEKLTTPEEKITFFEEQYKEMQEVDTQMKSSLEDGKMMIDSFAVQEALEEPENNENSEPSVSEEELEEKETPAIYLDETEDENADVAV